MEQNIYKRQDLLSVVFSMMFLIVLSMIRIILTLIHLHFIFSFVDSIPPGRKMVTSDVSILAHFFADLGKLSMYIDKSYFNCFRHHLNVYRIFNLFCLWLLTCEVDISVRTILCFVWNIDSCHDQRFILAAGCYHF